MMFSKKVALRRAYEIMEFCKYCKCKDNSPSKSLRHIYCFISREAAEFAGKNKG